MLLVIEKQIWDKKFWVDSYNNMWDASTTTEIQANIFANSLTDCWNCLDCTNSKKCNNCVCVNTCEGCSNCKNLEVCKNCRRCEDMYECIACIDCARLKFCYGCANTCDSEYCGSLKRCDNCKYSYFLEACSNCNNSVECKEAKYLENIDGTKHEIPKENSLFSIEILATKKQNQTPNAV